MGSTYIVAVHSDKHAAAARRDPRVTTPLLQSQQILLQLLHKTQARVLMHISAIGEDVESHLLAAMVGGRIHDMLQLVIPGSPRHSTPQSLQSQGSDLQALISVDWF